MRFLLQRLSRRDALCAAFIFATGLFALITGLSLDLGSLRRIGPGAFPAVIGAAMMFTGLAMLVFGREQDKAPHLPLRFRGAIMVLLGLAAFAVLIRPAGMVPAVFAAVVLSSYADPEARLRDALGVAAVMSLIAVIVFIEGLGFQARMFGAY